MSINPDFAPRRYRATFTERDGTRITIRIKCRERTPYDAMLHLWRLTGEGRYNVIGVSVTDCYD